MSGVCTMKVWDAVCRILIGNNGIRHVAELGMSGRKILKLFLKMYVVMLWTRFMQLRTEFGGGLLCVRK
jgi:hypothetical protein